MITHASKKPTDNQFDNQIVKINWANGYLHMYKQIRNTIYIQLYINVKSFIQKFNDINY